MQGTHQQVRKVRLALLHGVQRIVHGVLYWLVYILLYHIPTRMAWSATSVIKTPARQAENARIVTGQNAKSVMKKARGAASAVRAKAVPRKTCAMSAGETAMTATTLFAGIMRSNAVDATTCTAQNASKPMTSTARPDTRPLYTVATHWWHACAILPARGLSFQAPTRHSLPHSLPGLPSRRP